MKKDIDLKKVRSGNARLTAAKDGLCVQCERAEAALLLEGVDGAAMRGAKYLVVDLIHSGSASDSLFFRFYEGDGRCGEMHLALFPGARARALMRLELIDGSLLFPPVTPGTLKSSYSGASMRLEDITRVEIGFARGMEDERKFTIQSIRLTDDMPEFPAAEHATVDALGQWKQRSWPGKTRSAEELKRALEAEEAAIAQDEMPGRSRFGGDLRRRFESTGFFRAQKAGGRWLLVDPDGYAFFSSGVFGVYPGEPGWILGVEDNFESLPDPGGPFKPAYDRAGDLELFRRKFSGMFPDDTLLYAPATANLIRAFGANWYARWARLTAARLKRWGINTLSMFSDAEFVRQSKMPYVIMLKGYPVTQKTLFREFPDVFSEEYDQLSRAFAQQLRMYADDPLMIGYFLNNEPTWGFVSGPVLAEKTLECGQGTSTLTALIDFIRERYRGSIDSFNRAWNLDCAAFDELSGGLYRASERSEAASRDLNAFTGIMLEKYAGIPSKYARQAAPHHLNMGMRFARLESQALLQTAKHFDVFSFNCYLSKPDGLLRQVEALDMPMLVGEFHFGALDAGLPHPSLFHVRDQAARGEAYERYLTHAAAHKNGVGAHYFAYNDQPLWGRYDCENYQFGLVDVCNRPYAPFVEGIRRASAQIYDVMYGDRAPLPGETQKL
jgi:hypothetical protein